MEIGIAEALSYFLMYLGWILLTYSTFSELPRIARVVVWSVIAIVVGYFLNKNLTQGFSVGFFCFLFLYVFDERVLNGSRWSIEETIKKDFGFLNIKGMPLWLIITLDVLIFLLLYRMPDMLSTSGN